jgi:hypothetical protein
VATVVTTQREAALLWLMKSDPNSFRLVVEIRLYRSTKTCPAAATLGSCSCRTINCDVRPAPRRSEILAILYLHREARFLAEFRIRVIDGSETFPSAASTPRSDRGAYEERNRYRRVHARDHKPHNCLRGHDRGGRALSRYSATRRAAELFQVSETRSEGEDGRRRTCEEARRRIIQCERRYTGKGETSGTGEDGTSLTSKDGASGAGKDGASGTSKDGASGTGKDGASGTSKDGASGTGKDGASVTSKNGANVASKDGANGTSKDGASGTSKDGRGDYRRGSSGENGNDNSIEYR